LRKSNGIGKNQITEKRLEEYAEWLKMGRAYCEKYGEWSNKVKPEKLKIGEQRNVATK